MGSSIREPQPPSAFGFGQGTQGYQAAPIFMKDGQAYTRTGNISQADYENPMKRAMAGVGGSTVKRGVEPAPYSYQPISFGQPNQQQAYGPGKYGVARRYGKEAPATGNNYYQSGQSASQQAQRNLAQRKARKAQEANFKKVQEAMRTSARMPF
jgi:hypothetical protein